MRRPFALFALVVTTWSGVAVPGCAAALTPVAGSNTIAAPSGHQAHGAPASHDHGAHGRTSAPRAAQDTESGPHPSGVPDCGIAMACGTALGASLAAVERELPVARREIGLSAATAPTSADLTQDTPPPRRLA